jgi:hypothetical protein
MLAGAFPALKRRAKVRLPLARHKATAYILIAT